MTGSTMHCFVTLQRPVVAARQLWQPVQQRVGSRSSCNVILTRQRERNMLCAAEQSLQQSQNASTSSADTQTALDILVRQQGLQPTPIVLAVFDSFLTMIWYNNSSSVKVPHVL